MRLTALTEAGKPSIGSGPVVRRVDTLAKTDSAWRVSPDGRYMAITDWGQGDVAVVNLASGETRLLTHNPEGSWDAADLMAWSPDGRYIYFSKSPVWDGNWELWRIAREGGQPTNTGLKMQELRGLSVHPDGRKIAFAAGQQVSWETWVMENFLPARRAAR